MLKTELLASDIATPASLTIDQTPLDLTRLVSIARERSPYYAHLYRDIAHKDWQLDDLPLVQPEAYWQGNTDLKTWPVLTGPVQNAVVFKTGGTTGNSKLSVYTRAEWRAFAASFARSLSARLRPGDRVANLFFAGDLYASFIFIHGSLFNSPVPIAEYPFSGNMDISSLISQIKQYDINVLAGVPAKLLSYASALIAQQQQQLPMITTLLYGGESLFAEQLPPLRRAFPHACIASVGCASVDAGLIGESSAECTLGEHRVFSPETVVEIIDETTLQPIDEVDRSGLLVVTCLTRTLMPLIRYPVGDLAAWREAGGKKNRKFVLLGRSSSGHRVRIGYLTLYVAEVNTLIESVLGHCQWQLVITHTQQGDHILLPIAFPGSALHSDTLLNGLGQHYPVLTELVALKQLTVAIHWCKPSELQLHPISGKLLKIVDKRSYTL